MKVPVSFRGLTAESQEAVRQIANTVNANDDLRPGSNVITITADYAFPRTNIANWVLVDATGGNVTVTLPGAEHYNGQIHIMKIDGSGNSAIVAATNINGGASISTTTQYAGWAIASDNSNWFAF